MAPGYVDEDREDQEKEDIMQARLMEPRRTELLQGLPHRLASALPSLQYLTIIDDAPSLLSLAWADYRVAFNQGLVMAGPTDSGSEQGGAANSAEIIDSEAGMESRRTYQHYGQRCWKVVDAENGKELVNIDYDKLLSAREQAVEARAAPL
ncbi:hypothetical protein FKP32DRAFT_993639 [Trametes sanguinea]|nr:hypothetical protein FKP32DRAFT_993639 [Trametes sanguinea]